MKYKVKKGCTFSSKKGQFNEGDIVEDNGENSFARQIQYLEPVKAAPKTKKDGENK